MRVNLIYNPVPQCFQPCLVSQFTYCFVFVHGRNVQEEFKMVGDVFQRVRVQALVSLHDFQTTLHDALQRSHVRLVQGDRVVVTLDGLGILALNSSAQPLSAQERVALLQTGRRAARGINFKCHKHFRYRISQTCSDGSDPPS